MRSNLEAALVPKSELQVPLHYNKTNISYMRIWQNISKEMIYLSVTSFHDIESKMISLFNRLAASHNTMITEEHDLLHKENSRLSGTPRKVVRF